jgi:hypothetical protein
MDQVRHFADFGRVEWTRYRTQMAALGVMLPPGDAGSMTRAGVEVQFAFREGERMLSFTIVRLPSFWVPAAFVWHSIEVSVKRVESYDDPDV